MPNFTISEILTIMLVILIVFGPHRLPEMAQKTGQLIGRARSVMSDLRREFEGEWQEVAQPLKDVRQEMKGLKDDMETSMSSLSDEVAQAKAEIEAELSQNDNDVESNVEETGGKLADTVPDSPEEPGAEEDQQ
ncbi:MAG: twin-arginine translocase TatA/TatE family subunit [Acidimicrobiia bacterium]|nr:twin-arginine translocase TatA/TatE family subunit [Acidimicrobiia bacterium]